MIRIDHSPCDDYQEWLSSSNAFLDSPAWAHVLQAGFSAETRYVWDGEAKIGHLLAVFKQGPFSIGYLGFPLCLDARADAGMYALDGMINTIRRCDDAPDILRIPLSPFGSRHIDRIPYLASEIVETCITDLEKWSSTSVAKRRHDLSYAQRRCNNLTLDTHLGGDDLYALYRSAIRRNRGTVRYGNAYFNALAMLDARVLAIHALKQENVPVAMIVSATHGDHACYLHGGTSPSAMATGASDLLMARAIAAAQVSGLRAYNFLASPPRQRGLLKFKEKWGGTTRSSATAQIAFGLKGRILTSLLAGIQLVSTLRANNGVMPCLR